MQLKSIAVFCGANKGHHPLYAEVAVQFAKLLAKAKVTLIYGGGNVGLMQLIADAMLAEQAKVIGVMPEDLVNREVAHLGLTQLHIVKSMHERKKLMFDLAEAFVLMPGGAGSLDEFFEMFTWQQLGIHGKPCGLINVNHYFDHLIQFLDHAVQEGFLHQTNREKIIIASSPQALWAEFGS